MFDLYFNKLQELLSTVEQSEKETITRAAEAIAECIQKDGLIYVFGCGHSHMLAEELFYRAGGLAPIHPIFAEGFDAAQRCGPLFGSREGNRLCSVIP